MLVLSCHLPAVFEGSHGIFGLDEGVVDCNNLNIVVLDSISEDESSNSA